MSSSIDLPSIQTKFSPYLNSSSPSSRPYHSSPSPSSPSPIMSYQSRSYSTPSLSSRLSSSSLHSQYSSSSDRSMSCSPGPSTPNDIMSRSPSFSHERLHKPLMTAPMKHLMSTPFSPVLPQPKGYSNQSSIQNHHTYQQPSHNHPFVSIPHPSRQQQQQYNGQALPSPRDIFSPSVTSRDQIYDHRESQYHTRGDRSPYCGSGDYFSRPTTVSSYHHHHHHHLPTPTTPTAMDSLSSRIHPHSPAPMTPLQVSTGPIHPTPYDSPRSAIGRGSMDDDYSQMSRSPSVSSDRSSFSPESSPFPSDQSYMGRNGMNSPASSLSAALSSNNSSSASLSSSSSGSSSNPQLLLCPVCSRAFKPSKNQNCNLRRHLKNVHNMSPTMHPRKCKWDSLPDGRVKDDKDRKERTRKSKRLWARKFRLRRKVEEAAVVLSMLNQAS
ncbi:hypothetical protein BGZ76_010503 [Entomortierella beljakovae]|nr:hypothetical protein BGZ76_010503 [Entomortierella beljakovae]